MNRKPIYCRKNEKGAVAVVVAIAIMVLVFLAALAIDVGHLMVNKNELQNVADGAALAAARELGVIYTSPGMTPASQQNYVLPDAAPLVAAARLVSDKDNVDGQPVTISAADVKVGLWQAGSFTPTPNAPNAVRVTVRRDGAVNGPIATFLAGIMTRSFVDVSATATASLLNTLKIPEGGIQFPLGLSKGMFNGTYCGKSIAIYSTSMNSAVVPADAGCAGWNTLMEEDNGADTLRNILNGLKDGTYQSPEMIADLSALNFTNGNDATAFRNMADLFNAMKNCNNPDLDTDDDPNTWTTIAPVYDSSVCNPSGWVPISGFASVTVTGVQGPPDKVIHATINCNGVVKGVSGGVDFGTWGSIPNLVQ